jgi:inositol polyphosphate 5-phosphatase INPP5B/F
MFGMLIPGEQPSQIDFTMTVNKHTAQLLNSGREVLQDIIILRLENGRDYYITVKAMFARTCFGMSVDELVLYPQPIRNVPIDPIERAKQKDVTSTTALCVPKELWRIVDAIYEKGLGEPHLFVEPGIDEEMKQIREALDTGNPFGGPFLIHSYADILVSFLSSLASPIIPTALFPPTEIDSLNIQISARNLLEKLPPIHYNVFVYVISFFREVLQLTDHNLLTAAKVARICCSCMAPGTGLDNSNASALKRSGMQLIVLHLLETVSI